MCNIDVFIMYSIITLYPLDLILSEPSLLPIPGLPGEVMESQVSSPRVICEDAINALLKIVLIFLYRAVRRKP
jgi:hypothetical protein